jgi:hypothetical protein
MSAIVGVIIALIVIGVLVWGARKLLAIVPMEPWIKQVADVIIIVGAVILVVFYVIIPLLSKLGSMPIPGLH